MHSLESGNFIKKSSSELIPDDMVMGKLALARLLFPPWLLNLHLHLKPGKLNLLVLLRLWGFKSLYPKYVVGSECLGGRLIDALRLDQLVGFGQALWA